MSVSIEMTGALATGRNGPAVVPCPGDGPCEMRRIVSDSAALAEPGFPRRPWAHGQFFQEGLHSPDASVPRRLPLLHLRQAAARGGAAYLSLDEVLAIAARRAAAGCKEALFTLGDKPELRYAAARERARRARLREHVRLPRSMPPRPVFARDRPAAAYQRRRHGRGGTARAAPGVAPRWADARERVGAAVRARRAALRLARQAPGGAARHARGGGRAAVPFTTGHPDRHRRDPRRADRVAAGAARRSTRATATFRKSSSRTSAPSPVRGWRTRPSRRSTSCSGPSRVARIDLRARDDHPGAAEPAARRASRSLSRPASTTGAASRR